MGAPVLPSYRFWMWWTAPAAATSTPPRCAPAALPATPPSFCIDWPAHGPRIAYAEATHKRRLWTAASFFQPAGRARRRGGLRCRSGRQQAAAEPGVAEPHGWAAGERATAPAHRHSTLPPPCAASCTPNRTTAPLPLGWRCHRRALPFCLWSLRAARTPAGLARAAGEWRVGSKAAYELFPAGLKSRLQVGRSAPPRPAPASPCSRQSLDRVRLLGLVRTS